MSPIFHTPDWAKQAVWYQIFPERFRNGERSNDPPGTLRWQSRWYARLPGESGQFYRDVWRRRFGGDLQGILEKLPYLRQLGVNAIYLNPIFQGEDCHKYDTADHRHVDDHFGFRGDIGQLVGETDDPMTWQWTPTDRLFIDFLVEAHRQGFRVIIDGVFNHVGRRHFAFQDVLAHGRESRYADWFEISDWGPPIRYRAWDSHGALPAFKKDAKLGLARGPREHIMAITRRWLAPEGDPSQGVDGFRLDVAQDIPHAFWIDWRQMVKAIKPNALICGEIWPPAQAWLKGDQFDGVMNYQFAIAAQGFFVNQKKATSPTAFAKRMVELATMYPWEATLVCQNILDSHDTDRIASMFLNPDRPFDGANRLQDRDSTYNPAKPEEIHWRRMMQAVVFQMTFVGAPMIYYGDEAGMWGPDDPSNRQPMLWQDLEPYDEPEVTFNERLFAHYQRLIAIRRQRPALQLGRLRILAADDGRGVLAFARDYGDDHAYVVLNRSLQKQAIQIKLDDWDGAEEWIDWLNSTQVSVVCSNAGRPALVVRPDAAGLWGRGGVIRVELEPLGSAVLAGRRD